MKIVSRPYKEKTSAHKVAMLLDERGFRGYLGHRDDIDAETFQQLVYIKPVGKQGMGVILHSRELVRLDAFSWKAAADLQGPASQGRRS